MTCAARRRTDAVASRRARANGSRRRRTRVRAHLRPTRRAAAWTCPPSARHCSVNLTVRPHER
jgi:hypothetical protein